MEWVNNNVLAAAVRSLRLEAGMSQRVVAEALGYSRSAYAYKENGKIAFSVLDLQQLAALFQFPPDLFFHPELFPGGVPRKRKRKEPAGLNHLGSLLPEEQELIAMLRLYQAAGDRTLLNQFRETVREKLSSGL